jgi:RNA polymerase sigma-70 factor, ECF subfamily
MDYTTISDEDLARLLQSKQDEAALGELIRRYQQKLFYYVVKIAGNRDDAEDMVQETFLKVYENIQGFDADKKFSSWIYRISHNLTINHLKKNQRLKAVEAHTLDWLEEHHREVEDFLAKEERQKLTDEMVNMLEYLRPEYREVIVLYYFEEKSYNEISDILRIPEATVGVWLRRGREQLRKLVEKYERN